MNERLFGIHAAALELRSHRMGLLTSNIANAATPGYKARELAPPSFAALVDGSSRVAKPQVEISDAMKRLGAKPSSVTTIADPDISEIKPDGNNVTLEDQLLKMGQVQADYAALTSLYAKQMKMLKSALGKGGMA